jgi:hypothetical protein
LALEVSFGIEQRERALVALSSKTIQLYLPLLPQHIVPAMGFAFIASATPHCQQNQSPVKSEINKAAGLFF